MLSEEVETLEAALAFIDEYDAEVESTDRMDSIWSDTHLDCCVGQNTASSGLIYEHTMNDQAQRHHKKFESTISNKTSKGRSDPQRLEIIRLRSEVVDLEKRVQHLQRLVKCKHRIRLPVGRNKTIMPRKSIEDPEKKMKVQLISVWKDVASRHYELRKAAETENTQLRAQLSRQLRLARRLERMVQQQMALKNNLLSPHCRIDFANEMDADNATIEQLKQGLVNLYVDTNRVFETYGLNHIESPFTRTSINKLSTIQTRIDVVDTRVVPFGFKDVGLAVWYGIRMLGNHQQRSDGEAPKDIEDIFTRSCKPKGEGHCGSLFLTRGHHIFQKHVEEDRVVLVSVGRVKPLVLHGTPMNGVMFHEKFWFVIRGISDLLPNVSVLQVCAQLTIDGVVDTPAVQEEIKLLAKHLGNNVVTNTTFTLQQAEHALLRGQAVC